MNTLLRPFLVLSVIFLSILPFQSSATGTVDQVDGNDPTPQKVAPVNFYFPKNVYHFKVKDNIKAYYETLKAYLEANEGMKIYLTGYAYDGSKKDWNDRLSKYRANKVRDSLVDAGFKRNQIVIDFKGKSSPLAKDDSDLEIAKNRRVELRLK